MSALSSRLLSATVALALLVACSKVPLLHDAIGSEKLTTTQISEFIVSPDRSAADRTNDIRRKPAFMLDFIGVKPGMTVLDFSAGGGYTTELLARAVGPTGRVFGQSAPPAASNTKKLPVTPEGATSAAATSPATENSVIAAPVRRSSFDMLTERAKNTGLQNIIPVVRPFDNPVPPEAAASKLELVTLMFNYHDRGHLGVDRSRMNKRFSVR